MKKILVFMICLLAGLAVVLMFRSHFSQPHINDHAKLNISLGNQDLMIEIVNTPASITQGLSGRDEIGSDGMLFLLPQATIPAFWMKEMKFDLDLIWLKNKTVVDMTQQVPHPDLNTPLSALPIYSPATPADMVLEVNSGQVAAWQIKVGDKLSFH